MTATVFLPLLAQFLIQADSRAVAAARMVLEPAPGEKKADCSFETVPPRLGYSFTHWSGFNVAIRLRQFGSGVRIYRFAVVIEVTPKSGQPVYLGERFDVPKPGDGDQAPKGAEIRYTGGYLLGPGEYRIRSYIGTITNHVCRKEWTTRVSAGKVPLKLEPNQVTSVGGERWKGLNAGGDPQRRITVMIQASPLFPRRNMVRLSSFDRSVLLSSLTTLLDATKATAATVIAFDPHNRKVVFSAADFGPRDLGRLARNIAEINLGMVSLETLKGPSAAHFFESMMDSLDPNVSKSEAVVFLGPSWGLRGKPSEKLKESATALPPLHYLELTRMPGRSDSLIAGLVRSAGGEIRQIFTPADLAKGIEKLNK